MKPNSIDRSFWQPVPANGYVTVKLRPEDTGCGAAAMGMQTVGVGGFVREHAHPDQDEIIFVLEGEGVAVVDGSRHPMNRGCAFLLRSNVRHSFINTGAGELTFTWTIMPGFGLSEFFESIGRPRQEGEAAPQPFERPRNIAEIEAQTGFAQDCSR